APNTGATNSSGFTGLPGGYRLIDGSFDLFDTDDGFWSSSESTFNAWVRWLASYNAQMYRDSNNKEYGFSVRCLKD
ncbi:MAG: FISUMP domain-containing protein, partial [Bacteroidales bacterium]